MPSRRILILAGVALVAVVIAVGGLWGSFGGWTRENTRWIWETRQEGAEALAERHRLEAEKVSAQEAVRGLATQIKVLGEQAATQKAAAIAASARADAAAEEARQSRKRVTDLEAARRAMPVVNGIREAKEALRELGYVTR